MATLSNASPSMVKNAANLATTQKANTTATPVAQTNLKPTTTPVAKPATATNTPTEGDLKKAADSVPNTPTTATECAKIIEECDSIVMALECIGQLYGIPSENIVCDPTATDIKVQGDTIIAPDLSPQGKGAAIMKSIAAVLDYISQRIDNKMNAFQLDNMEKGAIDEHIKNDANPAKGKVIDRRVDPDGGEILIYDSGLVDMPNTFTAVNFVNQLRAQGIIPPIKMPDQPSNTGVSYFTDEDSIAVDPPEQGGSNYGDSAVGGKTETADDNGGGANYNNTVETSEGDENPSMEMDIPAKISESAFIMDMIAKRGDTRHLGYDLMMEQGLTFVKPLDFYMEAGDSKKAKNIKPEDIKHQKFDNTHITKAIKLMNEVRAAQGDVAGRHFDLRAMVNNPKWNQAVKELEHQFDCHISLKFLETKEMSESGSGFTLSSPAEVRQKCTISKSKGFQLNGLPITIYIVNKFFTMEGPTDPNLFGQFAVAVLLHEIFHNIYGAITSYSTEFSAMMTTTLITASLTKSAKVRRKLLTNFVNAIDDLGFVKLNPIQKRTYVKKLLLTCTLDLNLANMKDAKSLVEEGNSEQLDQFITILERKIAADKRLIYGHGTEVGAMCMIALEVLIGMVGLAYGVPALVTFALGNFLTTLIGAGTNIAAKSKLKREIADRENGVKKNYEEHWCDMFAAMYNLPEGFFSNPAKMTAATMRDDQIKRLHDIELSFVNIYGDPHPPTSERLAAAVKRSKQLLDSKQKLDPGVKSYLEWIVANHSRIIEVEDIDTKYSKSTFDPKTAENLDEHLQNLITKGNIQLTEQAIEYLLRPEEEIF